MNNYAVSSDGIATALKDSASALMEAGNNLEQATALVAAANRVVQDPNSVGSALRTISLRLRGTSVEILEEMGEETDGVIESTSKLQAKLHALTGVNILTDTGAYKDTYTILKEIGAVWQNLDSLDQAAALELMAGKNRANTLSAILNNMKDLESAYESALNATGSALKENETHLDSIQGKIEQFNNALQTMWMNFLNDEAVKTIIEIGTRLIQLIDNIGVLNTALGVYVGYLTFKTTADIFKKSNTGILDFAKSIMSSISGIKSWVTNVIASSAAAKAASVANIGLAGSIVTQSTASKAGAVATALFRAGLNTLTTSATVTTIAVTALAAAATMGLSVLASWAIPKVIEWFDNLHESAEETAEKVKEFTDEYKKAKKEFSENLDTLTISSDTKKYDTLLDEFEALSKGVNKFGENISLTTEEYNRYLEICDLIVGVNPSLADGYNNNAEAIGNNAGALRGLIELQEKEARLAAQEYVSMGRYSNNGKFTASAKNAMEEYKTAAQKLYKYTDQGVDGVVDIESVLTSAFDWSFIGSTDYGDDAQHDDLAKFIMESIGIAPEQIDAIIDEYRNQYGGFDIEGFQKWASDYTDEIAAAKGVFASTIQEMRTDDSAIGNPEMFAAAVLGYSEDDLDDVNGILSGKGIDKMLQAFIGDDGSFNYEGFKQQYGEYIGVYKDFLLDGAEELVYTWIDGYNGAIEGVQSAQDGMIDALLEVPNAIEGYYDLSAGTRSYFTEWIKNSPAFKIDENTTEEQITGMRDTIAKAVNSVIGNDALSEIFNDLGSLGEFEGTFGEYQEKVRQLFSDLYTELNKDGKAEEIFGLTEDGYMRELAVRYNVEWAVEGSDETPDVNKLIAEIMDLTGMSEEAVKEKLNNLKPIEVQRMVQYDYTSTEGHDNPDTPEREGGDRTFEELYAIANPAIAAGQTAIKTYSALTESMEGLNEAQVTAEELFANGAKTSEDYYNSLIELGIEEEALAECIDEKNDYMVTNADALRNLIKAQKEAIAADTKLAKSHEQLEYYNLVQSLDAVIGSEMVFSEESDAAAEALLEQTRVVKNSINQYQLLESTLLGAANAFEEFSKAQEQDSQNTYGEQYIEMAQVMYDAIYKTGEVGSAQFWAAVRANVPDDIYAHLTPGKEQLNAITNYLNENIFSGLVLDGESFSIDYTSIQKFIEKAQDVGVFTGTDASAFGVSQGFLDSLAADENALEAFAERMGTTTAHVYAMLSEIDKYNADGMGLSMLFQLDNSITSQLTLAANEYERLLIERRALLKQGASEEELNANMESLYQAEAVQQQLKQQAMDVVAAYAMIDNAVADTSKKVKDVLPESVYIQMGLTGDETVQDSLETINDYRLTLEEPTVLELSIAKQELEDLENLDPNITAHVVLNEDSGLYELINEDGYTGEIDLQHYVELKNAESFINASLEEGLTTTDKILTGIATDVATIAGKDATDEGSGTTPEKDDTTGAATPASKPEINEQGVIYAINTGKDIAALSDAIKEGSRQIIQDHPLGESMLSDYAIRRIGEIYAETAKLQKQFDNGEILPEDARVRLSELASEAEKLGIEIPVILKADPGQIITEVSGEQAETEMPVETITELDEVAQSATESATSMWKAYDNAIKGLSELSPDTLIPADEFNALAESLGLNIVAEDAVRAADALDIVTQARKNLESAGSTGSVVGIVERDEIYTLSELQSKTSSYNDIMSQTNEIVANGVTVTQSYKDSLLDLCETQEERNELEESFDGLLVTNEKQLKKFVNAKKEELKTDVKLSKAQAQLEYYELGKQIQDLTKDTDAINAETLEEISILYAEMSALQGAIAQYSLLETKLLGAANAYDRLAEAQQIDSDTDYGARAEELINVLGNAFNTHELGTQAAQVAIEGLIPESVFKDVDDLDEKMQKIYEYFTQGEVSQLFTIEFDEEGGISSVEMTEDNVKKFTEGLFDKEIFDGDGNSLGTIFTGSWDAFELNDQITSLEQFAEACGITEEVAFAFLTSLEKYDISWLNGDRGTILDQLMGDDLAYGVQKTTQEMAELNNERAKLLQKGRDNWSDEEINRYDEINTRLGELNGTMDEYQEAAYNAFQDYTATEEAITGLEKIDKEAKLTSEQFEALGLNKPELGLEWDENTTVQQYYDQILEKQIALGKPTELIVQLANDKIQEEIDTLVEELGEGKVAEIEAALVFNETTGKYEFSEGYEADDAAKQYAELKSEAKTLETYLQTGIVDTTTYLSSIQTILSEINSKIPGNGTNSGGDGSGDGGNNSSGGGGITSGDEAAGRTTSRWIEWFNSQLGPRGGGGEASGDGAGRKTLEIDEDAVELNFMRDKAAYEARYGAASETGGFIMKPGAGYIDPAYQSGGGDAIKEAVEKMQSKITPSVTGPYRNAEEKFNADVAAAVDVVVDGINTSAKHAHNNEVLKKNKAGTTALMEEEFRNYPSVTPAYQAYEEINKDGVTPLRQGLITLIAEINNGLDLVTHDNAQKFGLTLQPGEFLSSDFAVSILNALIEGTEIAAQKASDAATIDYNPATDSRAGEPYKFTGPVPMVDNSDLTYDAAKKEQLLIRKANQETADTVVINADGVELTGQQETPPVVMPTPTPTPGPDSQSGQGVDKLPIAQPLRPPVGTVEDIVEANDALNEYNESLGKTEEYSQSAGQEARELWTAYSEDDAAIAALSAIEDKTQILTKEDDTFGIGLNEGEYITVENALALLTVRKEGLEQPIVMSATLAMEEIDDQISELESAIANDDFSNLDPIEFGLEVGDVPTKADVEAKIAELQQDRLAYDLMIKAVLDEESKETLDEEFGNIQDTTFDDKDVSVYTDGYDLVMQQLQAIDDYTIADKSYKVTQTNDSSDTGGKPGGKNINLSQKMTKLADGTAHALGTAYQGGSWGAPKTETALVGELGPEMRVRGNRWELIGQNGAEFTDVRKGDIIFNHRQTKDLLSKGYVTGRGKAYASGTAYAGIDTWGGGNLAKDYSNTAGKASASLSKAANDLSKSSEELSDEFKEVFDWIAVRIEEITEAIDLKSAKLENAIGSANQNAIIDDMLELNKALYDNLTAGASKYYEYSEKLLAKIPAEHREAAKNGSIAIESFTGEVGQKTYEAIEDYREWVQKGSDLTQQAEETLTEISTLAKQAIDNIAQDYENKLSLPQNVIDQLEAYNALIETTRGAESVKVYEALIKENNKNLQTLTEQRQKMQSELNEHVAAGNIKKYSQDWYDAINDIAALDTEIIELTTDINDYQDSINELHWDHFENLIGRLEAISDEADNLIEIIRNKDVVDDDGNWTDEGITALGLYAQELEAAEVQAQKYKEEITYLNKNWRVLGYTEQEYVEKLEELKSGQYDAIKAYNDTKKAIKDLTSERVEAIKEGIQKEIEAYEELISKKKEELDSEKDLYDFQKGVANQQKEIADIERKLAALSSDNSSSARAARAKLQAELAEAQQELQDTYYERSHDDQIKALDKELESFQEEKDKEIESLDEYLEETEQIVSDALTTIQSNTDIVYNTLADMGKEYSLSIADALTSPWEDGEAAIQDYSEQFKLSMSSTVEELYKLAEEYDKVMSEIEDAGRVAVSQVNNNTQAYQNNAVAATSNSSSSKSSSAQGSISSLSGNIQYGDTGSDVKKLQQALNELGYGNSGTSSVDGVFGSGTRSAVQAFQKAMGITADGIVGPNTKQKFKANGYAKGTTGVKKDQLAIIDELGEELVMHAGANGKLAFMSKGSTVIPHDITENLLQLSELDPQDILERNKPEIAMSPSVVNNNMEISIDASVGELIHVETLNGNNPAEVAKIVDKAWDKYMKELNGYIRRYTR